MKSLPKDLKKVGADASKEIGDRFEQLESDVDAKQDALVDDLATKYVAARKGLDERIEELQAENRGLIDKAIGAIKAVINTIRELVAMLTRTCWPGSPAWSARSSSTRSASSATWSPGSRAAS